MIFSTVPGRLRAGFSVAVSITRFFQRRTFEVLEMRIHVGFFQGSWAVQPFALFSALESLALLIVCVASLSCVAAGGSSCGSHDERVE